MSHSLPNAPSLEQLRKQAKDLLKAHRSRDAGACGPLRGLRQFERASDEAILGGEVSLHDAQHAIAKAYGFESWPQLKKHVEEARGESPAGRVRREAGRVWIEGVPELRWGQSGECTFAGALSAALAVTPRPVAYADLMGFSGLAFRVRWFRRFDEPQWCPSSPVGEFSEEILTVARAIGWQVRQESEMGKDSPRMDHAAPAIRESIEAGRPVVGYPNADLNAGVAYGFEEAGGKTTFLWNSYRGGLRVPADQTGPWLMFLQARGEPMSPREATAQALTTPNWRRRRLEHWNPKPGQDARYLYGDDALRQWREDIAGAEAFSPEQRGSLFFVGWWCFDCLVDARRAAARFLSDHAGDLGEQARPMLAQAASIYGSLAQRAVAESFENHAAFLGPWSGKKLEDWSADVRRREQELLSEIESMDCQAVGEIDKALAL